MTTNDDKDERQMILRESLIDLRRIYDFICTNYDQLRVKSLALIVAETAIISFIFAGGNSDGFSLPKAVDRRIFFFTAMILFALAFGILLWIISTVTWRMPHDIDHLDKLVKNYRTKDEYLEHVHSDYVKDIEHNVRVTSQKFQKFNWAVYLLSAAVIIILVIKYGGQTNDNTKYLTIRHGNSTILKVE